MCISELNNTGESGDFEALRNRYTDTAEAIKRILCDDDGNVRQSVKGKMLSLLGYKDLDYKKGVSRLQEEKAQRENELLRKGEVSVEEVDDDVIHVEEHTRYALIEYDELSKEEKQRIFAHVKAHKDRIKENKETINEKTGE